MDMKSLHELVGNGKIFSAKFIKRTTGEERVMVARLGVKKYLKGDGTRTWNPMDKQLLTVFDMVKKEYRFISADSLIEIKIEGITVKFDADEVK